MTEDEKLAQIGKALSAAENDPLQPACVARAFLDPEAPEVFGIRIPQVTMRAWLQLELVRSPYVTGIWTEDAVSRVQAVCTAVGILSGQPIVAESIIGEIPVAEVLAAEVIVALRVGQAFDTFLALQTPPAPGETLPPARDPGTGWWIKVLAALMGELSMPLNAALDTPVCQAFALVAGDGVNAGKEVVGESWRVREVMDAIERSAQVISGGVASGAKGHNEEENNQADKNASDHGINLP